MPNEMLTRLAAGQVLTGMMCFSGSATLVETMGRGGLDFTIIDLEHCPTTLETAVDMMRAAQCAGLCPFVRVPGLDGPLIGRLFDFGAGGVVLPHATAESVRVAQSATRFPPEGTRGACPIVRAAGYGGQSWSSFTAAQKSSAPLLIPLIEDVEAISEAGEMFDIEGIDVIFVGPFDLAISAGLYGKDWRDPEMRAMLDTVVAAAAARNKYVMTTVGATIDEAYAAELLRAGVRLLSFSADLAVFLTACRAVSRLATGDQAKK